MSGNPIERLRKELNLEDRDLVLPSSLGPITVQSLMSLGGWEYDETVLGFPGPEIALVRGDPPLEVFQSSPEEMGWGLLFAARFRSPFAVMNLVVDSFTFNSSVEFANAVSPTFPKTFSPYVDVYDPFTAFGPIFGVIMEPAIAMPYNRNLRMTVSLPADAPVAATALYASSVTRARIQDYKSFTRSVKRINAEQMTGEQIERVI